MTGRVRAIGRAVIDRFGIAVNRAGNLYPWQVDPVLYLRFRGSRAAVIPLDAVEGVLSGVTVATNVHSFSECRAEAIHWWVSRLAAAGVRHLMVVPDARDADGRCLTNAGEDMDAMIRAHGYAHVVTEPRHADPIVQRWGVNGCLISLYALA